MAGSYREDVCIKVRLLSSCTVNPQILTAIKFGVSQSKVIWRLLNLASPRLCSVRSTYDHVC